MTAPLAGVEGFDLCVSGDGLTHLQNACRRLAAVTVWARVSPQQKEYVLAGLKASGHIAAGREHLRAGRRGFAVHYYALTQVLDLAHAAQGLENRASLDAQFTPNMVNTAVFLITSAMQVATFTINHRFKWTMVGYVVGDFVIAFVWDRVCLLVFRRA
ncbi:uncharacterized protein ACA1_396100 [Acanthamoeba castellanii str. Neff]|uniref:Uncharacterized protein n=1 Tax=Acanthamoeba castellanii (strain ATCC 30010 / Neff) TaxID=1257118 RepID=L8HCA3_ACACF|nr:uncharacterized protein ACA1_396100 [Acanthamoeba castellanii str. Neff]ELR22825.1 hypothetical protein ACA1_396100 [Acanthamoeba castellanii str. Neff]